jgi:hypothetical protein
VLPGSIEALGEAVAKEGPVAYVEAEFFGGTGTQACVTWEKGGKASAALIDSSAINTALRFLGVEVGDSYDEFDALRLGLFRRTEEWLEILQPRIDFQIAEILPNGRVTGRNCGADIPVGTVFSRLYRRDFPAREPGEEIESPDLVLVNEIHLQLDSIEMFRRNLDIVGSGCTAALSLSGPSLPILSDLLSEAPKRTYYSLCSFG